MLIELGWRNHPAALPHSTFFAARLSAESLRNIGEVGHDEFFHCPMV
jgi:hypothetical protein